MALPLAMPGSRRNTVRFDLQNGMEMELQFSRLVLQKELGFLPTQMDYIFALPGKKTFEVVFTTSTFFEKCLRSFEKLKETRPQLANVGMVSLSQTEPKTITILMFSEQVRMEDIKTWLQQRCTVVHGYEMRDEDGIRTGGRRFFVQLKRDLRTGETYHLPPVIQLGSIRGHVFYPGQPKVCHRCGSQQHLLAECQSQSHCKNCKNGGHLTKNCPYPVNCNLCGERGHIFKTCPKSYVKEVPPQQESDLGDQLLLQSKVTKPKPDVEQQQEDAEERLDTNGGIKPTSPPMTREPKSTGSQELGNDQLSLITSEPPKQQENIFIYKKYEITETNVIKIVGSLVKDYMWKMNSGKKREDDIKIWKVPETLYSIVN
uniref:CCHC-type domain-containing protein n=1 Tax=Poecilia mexicana TaxID=48701 RepID=A0A3B3WNL9_9TELE